MQPDTAKAHAATLREWAVTWERDAAEGSSEVVFLMGRLTRMIERSAGLPAEAEPPPELPRTASTTELRDG